MQPCAVARTVIGLNPHQCLWIHGLQVRGSNRLGCHAAEETVSKCHTRSESEDHTSEKACKQEIHSGFETQSRCRQKSKTGVSVDPQIGLVSPEKIINK